MNRNEAIVAARYAPPRLPPNWGASLTSMGPVRVREKTATPEQLAAMRAHGLGLTQRLIRFFVNLADAGLWLPTYREIAVLLRTDKYELNEAMEKLKRSGDVIVHTEDMRKGTGRIIYLPRERIEVRTADAPPQTSFLPPEIRG